MLNKLERGNKYTLVGNDGFLEFNIQIILVDYIYLQYAQYGDVPYITFKRKGGRKTYSMFLNYKYSFLEGWQKVEMSKYISEDMRERIRYEDLKLENIIVSGKVGTLETNKSYEGLIDQSSTLIYQYGRYTQEYKDKFKEYFTSHNYSLNKEMKNYYRENHDYFLKALDTLVENLGR